MTIVFFLLAGAVAAVFVIMAVEKKRVDGKLTYPLWRGNLLIPWALFAGVFAVLMGSYNLPQFVGLAKRGVSAQAKVIEVKSEQYCTVTYRYQVAGKDYTDSDSFCGLKAGAAHTVYYDPVSPDVSTLYPPSVALKDMVVAMTLICLCLPTALVLWLMATHVIGRRNPI
jgi:hypothetical protein